VQGSCCQPVAPGLLSQRCESAPRAEQPRGAYLLPVQALAKGHIPAELGQEGSRQTGWGGVLAVMGGGCLAAPADPDSQSEGCHEMRSKHCDMALHLCANLL